ncbi:MAG: DNA starvation/stationary phase protection protein [Cytophagales bacterium]|nr:DNA starvation/stationary phase protection protein [Cytophagales bacterium]
MSANIGIFESNLQAVARILNFVLADEMVLLVKTRNFHWNVKGMHFSQLHSFFDSQYEQLNESVDEVAERVRALGEYAIGSLEEFKSQTRLKESLAKGLRAEDMLRELLNDHETLIKKLRTDIDDTVSKYQDVGTSDFLTGLMEEHEKMAWMIRSYLE